MTADVMLLPGGLPAGVAGGRTIVVLDVLRATTTMAAALAAGVREIRVFADVGPAKAAADAYSGQRLLCGEVKCLPPEGFDLGNSPSGFREEHAGQVVFMSTTNGTRAIVAAAGAGAILTGALVNARAVARQVVREGRDVLMLCAGTDGAIAMEDVLGAGAVLAELGELTTLELNSDVARIAVRLYDACRTSLGEVLRNTQGGRNVIAAGLAADIDDAARINAIEVVGKVALNPPRVVPAWNPD